MNLRRFFTTPPRTLSGWILVSTLAVASCSSVPLAPADDGASRRSPIRLSLDPGDHLQPLAPTGTPDMGLDAPLRTAIPVQREDSESATSVFLAIGPGVAPQFEGSSELQPIPFTVARVEKRGVSLEVEGLAGRLDLVPDSVSERWSGGLSYELRFAREDVDDAVIDALEPVDTAFEVGGFVRYVARPGWQPDDSLETRLTVNVDQTGAHDGTVATLESEYAWFARPNLRFSLGLSASYASDEFMDAYFGVSEIGAAASGLAPYDPSSGLRSLGIQASTLFLWNRHHGIYALVRYDQLVGDVADSPIVDDAGSAGQVLVGLSYAYRF